MHNIMLKNRQNGQQEKYKQFWKGIFVEQAEEGSHLEFGKCGI
jgi:hypothetical protein